MARLDLEMAKANYEKVKGKRALEGNSLNTLENGYFEEKNKPKTNFSF